jgi:hypothetical protein
MEDITLNRLIFKAAEQSAKQLPVKVKLSAHVERGRIFWRFDIRTLDHQLIYLSTGEDRQDRPAHAAIFLALKKFEQWRRDNKNSYRITMLHAPGVVASNYRRAT